MVSIPRLLMMCIREVASEAEAQLRALWIYWNLGQLYEMN